MPFGISSAPEVFQKKNEALFGDIDGVEIIFDDIIVTAESEVEHDTIVRKLLQRAREANVKFNEAKLQFKVSKVKYMGNIVFESGLKPDDVKIRAILEMPVPESKEELQRLLGMVKYFTQFIPNQSTITAPLRQLLKKDVGWMWLLEHTSAIQELKQILSSKPVLKFFDSSKLVKLPSRCIKIRTWCLSDARWSPSSICVKIPHVSRRELCSDRGASGRSFWL